jgi:hypothetical protein
LEAPLEPFARGVAGAPLAMASRLFDESCFVVATGLGSG